jgi:hypothetical protein
VFLDCLLCDVKDKIEYFSMVGMGWVDLLVGSLLCESGSDHLRQVFSTQMGLSDHDIVALSGGHTLVGGFFCVCVCQLLKAGAYA